MPELPDPHVQELNLGDPSEPRQAASIVLVRAGSKHSSDGLEVLLGKRTSQARFMADVWVFPGGAVDSADGDELAHRTTAIRELEEEVGVRIADPQALVPFSRWITPFEVKMRFDTHFFLAPAPPHCSPVPDGEEIVETVWITPQEALERQSRDELLLVFPTIRQLERLARAGSVEAAFADAQAQPYEPILPRVIQGDAGTKIVLPWEPDYPAE